MTLLVTIAAGGLGSVVAFTKNFWRGDKETGPGRLLVNIGEGVAAAIAIFLFAGAGMLMMTQGAAGARGNMELSPYMVAFIAFVSGFLAEDAFNRIQEAGKNLFRVDDGNSTGRAEDEDSDPGDDGTGNASTKTAASPNVEDRHRSKGYGHRSQRPYPRYIGVGE